MLASGQPFLGICLGGNYWRGLGATVKPHPEGLAEIGYFAVEPTPAGQAVFHTPLHVYHWHHQGFDLPAGAELLATASAFLSKLTGMGLRPSASSFILKWIGPFWKAGWWKVHWNCIIRAHSLLLNNVRIMPATMQCWISGSMISWISGWGWRRSKGPRRPGAILLS
jgi:hypothetical protein